MSDIAAIIASIIIETERLRWRHRNDLIYWAMDRRFGATKAEAERAFLIAAEIFAADHLAWAG
ncbi:hypothetical protein [Methylobacterium sp. WL8]|uniref:hypothetical protein n=1 Tax=Methylobacterium sp. WL8 TaxID=2603899 RepID=UPI0011C96CD9|nr:hypothetical protein [Methylobacterium sp. WL8]TXN81954.1 hypothetical protein FV234_11430 [Methylobacterium sp. WL8]